MSTIPDFDIDRARDDFETIFDMNKIACTRLRENDDLAGDFFKENSSSTRSTATIYLNIQGLSTAIRRAMQGVTTKLGHLHAYAKYNTDIREKDIIIINTSNISFRFKINNFAPGMKGDNQYVFQEFDLEMLTYNNSDGVS